MTHYQMKCLLFKGIQRIFPETFTADRNDLVNTLRIDNAPNNYSALWYYIDDTSIPNESLSETMQWLIKSLTQYKHELQILINK